LTHASVSVRFGASIVPFSELHLPMSDLALLLNFMLLLVLIFMQRRALWRRFKQLWVTWQQHGPRRWRPQSPHHCPHCQAGLKLHVLRSKADIRPYSARKSRRGRKKTVNTRGFACPNLHCAYRGVTDDTLHALVGYGSHNGIPRFKCQACAKVFTSRVNTPLYYLKTDPKQVEFVLWFLAEEVDVSVLVRFTGHADATLVRWLERMGTHSQHWHNHLFRNLVLPLVQMDELYTRIRATASAAWLWLAFDPVSKAIPSLHLGGRTKDDAFALVHDCKLRLSPDCIPAVTTDGLRSYFYALTAHFGSWFRPPKACTDHWQPSDALHYGQLVKRTGKRRHVTFTHTRMLLGKRQQLFARLRAAGLRPFIQTAFVEHVNLTFRQSVAALSRRTWAYAQTEHHLLLHCEWFRLYYHFVRAHESLALEVPGLKRRFRPRSPAMALQLTDHLWSVHDLLHLPVPQVA
jgi:transposase-like protein/IS1 family transposase